MKNKATDTLTSRQSKFVRLIIEGCSLSDAYRQSYDASGMNERSIHVEASRLRHNPDVSLAVERGLGEAMGQSVWSRRRAISRLKKLNDVSLSEIEDGRISANAVHAFLASLDRLDRLHGVDTTKSDADARFNEMVDAIAAQMVL